MNILDFFLFEKYIYKPGTQTALVLLGGRGMKIHT